MAKRVRTDADRRADKVYKEKVQPIQCTIQYKKDDKKEGQRLLAYLEAIGKSRQSYIKELIKADLDSKGIPYPEQVNGSNAEVGDRGNA